MNIKSLIHNVGIASLIFFVYVVIGYVCYISLGNFLIYRLSSIFSDNHFIKGDSFSVIIKTTYIVFISFNLIFYSVYIITYKKYIKNKLIFLTTLSLLGIYNLYFIICYICLINDINFTNWF
jgi:hypothetical protein